MVDWFAVEDGYVITNKMTDWEVWLRSQLFGSPAAVKAIENWINNLEIIKVDKHPGM